MSETRRQAVLLLTTMVVALIGATGTALAVSQLDQQQTSSNGERVFADFFPAGQTFTAGVSGELDKVSVYVGCCDDGAGNHVGPPASDLIARIFAVNSSSGLPTGDSLGGGSVPASSFPIDGSFGWVDIALSPAPGVEAGKQYALVLSDYDSTTLYEWGYTTPDAYPRGTAIFGCFIDFCNYWQKDDAYDFAFKTFVGPDTTSPDTSITSGPSGPTNDDTPTFSFSGSDNVSAKANLLYSYKLDNGDWSTYSSATSVTLGDTSGLSEGAHTFYVKAKDEASNEDQSPAQQSFMVDTAAPTGTVLINKDAARTRTRSVTLKLNVTDPSPTSGMKHMRISNSEAGLSSAAWEPYATKKSWRLSSGQGMKTVYVQYKDAAGNISAVAKDTIKYRR